MAFTLMPLAVVVYATTMGLINDILNWALVYRRPGFQAVNNTLERLSAQATKAEKQSSVKRAKKREASLTSAQASVKKSVTRYNLACGFISACVMAVSFRLVARLFGSAPIARLPFEPPALLRKLTHRGLPEEVDADVCSAIFIYIVCQASVRALVSKFSILGPGKAWEEASKAKI